MAVIRIMALCVAAAMACALLRLQRPEMATVLSLTASVAVLGLLLAAYSEPLSSLYDAWQTMPGTVNAALPVARAAGIAVLGELAAQLCRDAGERALAGRVSLAARVAILALCLPILMEIGDVLRGLLP